MPLVKKMFFLLSLAAGRKIFILKGKGARKNLKEISIISCFLLPFLKRGARTFSEICEYKANFLCLWKFSWKLLEYIGTVKRWMRLKEIMENVFEKLKFCLLRNLFLFKPFLQFPQKKCLSFKKIIFPFFVYNRFLCKFVRKRISNNNIGTIIL